MARSSIQKLRQRRDKEGNPIVKNCDICGKPLTVGEPYKSVWNYYNSWDMHTECYSKCPRSRWETSEYRGQVYDIQDNFNKDDIDSTISSLEDLKYDQEERLENIPEQLRYADAGSTLQDRIDALDEAITSIETLRDEIEDIKSWDYGDYNEEYQDEESFEDYRASEIENKEYEIEDRLSDIDI